jgi:hypothetical protein
MVSITPWPCFTPGERTSSIHGQEAGWAPESVWMQRLEEKSFAPAWDRTLVVQPVVRHHTHWATLAPLSLLVQPLLTVTCNISEKNVNLLSHGLPYISLGMIIYKKVVMIMVNLSSKFCNFNKIKFCNIFFILCLDSFSWNLAGYVS